MDKTSKEQETEKVDQTPEEGTQEKEVSLTDIQAKLDQTEKSRQEMAQEVKKLGAMLTKTQQENAEYNRFLKSQLPNLNKSFEDRWESSPEGTIKEEVESKYKPIDAKLQRLEIKQVHSDIIRKHPNWTKYEERVVELGDEFPDLTWSEKGLTRLYQIAESDDLRSENEKLRSNGKAEAEKERAFTEGSTPTTKKQKSSVRISPEQERIAKNLGVKPEEYLKYIGITEKGHAERTN